MVGGGGINPPIRKACSSKSSYVKKFIKIKLFHFEITSALKLPSGVSSKQESLAYLGPIQNFFGGLEYSCSEIKNLHESLIKR